MPSMGLFLKCFIDQCFVLFLFQIDIVVPLSTIYIYINILQKMQSLVCNQCIFPSCVRITDVDRNSHWVRKEPISCVRIVVPLLDEMSKAGRYLNVKWP